MTAQRGWRSHGTPDCKDWRWQVTTMSQTAPSLSESQGCVSSGRYVGHREARTALSGHLSAPHAHTDGRFDSCTRLTRALARRVSPAARKLDSYMAARRRIVRDQRVAGSVPRDADEPEPTVRVVVTDMNHQGRPCRRRPARSLHARPRAERTGRAVARVVTGSTTPLRNDKAQCQRPAQRVWRVMVDDARER